MAKKIACLITSMFEDSEFTEPAKAFVENGHEILTIGTEKGKEVQGKQGKATISIDYSIDEITPQEYDALFLPGGFSPDILRADERFVQFTKHFMDESKPVFAICHGPQLLISAKTLEGRQVTGYKSIKVDLENAGATYKDEQVVVCGDQLVTSRTPDDIPAFIRESSKLLEA
ncbi:type 1 glutamine amidotransferase domain-containing protein [Bacillus sp. FJAT-27445]|uniref:type 1 glutamine amidotransferase domain-containing protein n=1 Tax=Bacillus sp. FJAT-27445 TaxID=1679166 RepID=UPI0007440607|nr:type 1 glutamine amidotransferase domain-containing protein [Bacillus sp. FJAT-27445]